MPFSARPRPRGRGVRVLGGRRGHRAAPPVDLGAHVRRRCSSSWRCRRCTSTRPTPACRGCRATCRSCRPTTASTRPSRAAPSRPSWPSARPTSARWRSPPRSGRCATAPWPAGSSATRSRWSTAPNGRVALGLDRHHRRRHRRRVERRHAGAARPLHPGDPRPAAGRAGRRHGPDRGVLRLQPAHEAARAVGLPLRAGARLRAAHDDVPLDRHPGEGDPPQPALGRSPPTACSSGSSRTGTWSRSSASSRSAGSPRGCRCSCS